MDSVPICGGTESLLGLFCSEGYCEPQRRWEAQTSSGQNSLVTAGRANGQVKVERVGTLLNTADLGTIVFDATRRKQLMGMLLLREHERMHDRVVDGRRCEGCLVTLMWIVL